jgi:hypothetical protein
MKNFVCTCGQLLFFENTRCLQCGSEVGFDPEKMSMYPLQDMATTASNSFCKNRHDYGVCNWFVTQPDASFCLSCSLNQTIPNLLLKNRRRWWKSLEHAKRRLIFTLLRLGLPVTCKDTDPHGLAFRFIEDKRSNPRVFEEHVMTGHFEGVITINITEADDVTREISRASAGEMYRTLLGHFRHESGHFYFEKLLKGQAKIADFRRLFGDERADYGQALKEYYAKKYSAGRIRHYISHYAQSHPYEDWAEVWAHYLHMIDTLETAGDYDLKHGAAEFDKFDETLTKWTSLTMMLNSLNRSMGLEDAYPFFLSHQTLKKLRFVHGLIYPNLPPKTTEASA